MIEVRNLSKRFRDKKRGEIRAVDGVSFRCAPGQIYGLLGANGAGKTTTLRAICGMVRTEGAVRFAGQPITGGKTYAVKAGDWLAIPPNDPHWQLPAPNQGMSYLLLKINAGIYPGSISR